MEGVEYSEQKPSSPVPLHPGPRAGAKGSAKQTAFL